MRGSVLFTTTITTTKQHYIFKKNVPVGGALLPNVCSLTPPKKAQLRAPLSPLQTAWTGFNPNLYSGGSSSAGPALVEIATVRSFIVYTQQGHCDWHNVCHTPGARMVSSAFHSTEAEDDPLLYKLGSRLFARERVELLIELFWEVRESKHLATLHLIHTRHAVKSINNSDTQTCTKMWPAWCVSLNYFQLFRAESNFSLWDKGLAMDWIIRITTVQALSSHNIVHLLTCRDDKRNFITSCEEQ